MNCDKKGTVRDNNMNMWSSPNHSPAAGGFATVQIFLLCLSHFKYSCLFKRGISLDTMLNTLGNV